MGWVTWVGWGGSHRGRVGCGGVGHTGLGWGHVGVEWGGIGWG